MKNKFYKLAALFVAGAFATQVGAQGFKDITSEALMNPSFELSAEGVPYEAVVSKNLTSLYGWEIPTPQEQSIANASSTEIGFTNNGKGGVEPSDGNFFFWCRKGWGNANGSLSTNTNELEAGIYYIEFDYKLADYTNNNNYANLGSAMNVVVKSGDNELVATTLAKRGYAIANNGSNPGNNTYMLDAPWTKMGAMFVLPADGIATITVNQNLKNSGRSDVCYDNFKLYRVYFDEETDLTEFPLDVTGYIANPSFEAGGESDNYSYHGWTAAKTGGEIDVRTSGTNVFGANLDGIRIFNAWDGSSTNDKSISQVIAGLPVGKYKLTAYVGGYKGTSMTLFAGESTAVVSMEEGTEGESNAQLAELTFTKKNTENLTIGINSTVFYKADNFRLYYLGEDISIYKDSYTEALAAAQAAIGDDDYDNVIGKEYADLTNAITTYSEVADDKQQYTAATTALTTATKAFTAAKDNYDALVVEIAKAKALGIADADSYAATAESTAATALASTQALKVAEYNYVATNYSYSVTLGDWTTDAEGTKAADFSNEHWSGETRSYKNQDDSNGQGWNASAWSINFSQDVELPAGDYVFKVAARQASGDQVTTTLIVKKGEEELGSVSDFPRSSKALGINKAGATSFDPADEAGFANNGNGYGWEWRYVKFSLTEPATVNVAVNSVATAKNQWVSFGDYTLQTNDDANISIIAYNIALNDATNALSNDDYSIVKGELRANLQALVDTELDPEADAATIDDATAALNDATDAFKAGLEIYNALYEAIQNAPDQATANVGNGAFQRSADYSEVEHALVSANEVYDDENAQVNALITVTEDLKAAGDAYNTLNAPTTPLKLMLTQEGFTYTGHPITFANDGNVNQGGYSLSYSYGVNDNYAQAFTFIPVDGKINTYNLSFVPIDGVTRYICTGTVYGGDNKQLRVTDDASKALEIRVDVTDIEGIVKFYNTAQGAYIGSNGNEGFYTDNKYTNFTVAEATQAEVTLTVTEAGWATLMLPFNADVPAGLTVYSCAEVGEDNVLTLTKVDEIAANTPYVVESEAAEYEFAGYGLAKQDTYTDGIFTGTYAKMTAIIGSYVLQTQNDYTAFYIVGESIQPTVGANRCYITPSTSSAPMFSLERGEGTTGIDNAAMTEAQAPVIYDLAGRRVEKLGKGIFIMNGKKVIVK